MSRNWDGSGLYDQGMIDDRNERPLTIALATIVVWMLAFGLVSVSAHIGAQLHHSHHVAESSASIQK